MISLASSGLQPLTPDEKCWLLSLPSLELTTILSRLPAEQLEPRLLELESFRQSTPPPAESPGKLTPDKYRKILRIDCNGESKTFDSVLDDWQRADFEAMDPGWCKLVGVEYVGNKPLLMRAYEERPRGHSKTTDEAAMVCYALATSERKIIGYAAASDKEQAGLLREQIDTLLRLNPWLGMVVECQKWDIVNKATGSKLTILASDEDSNYGQTPNFLNVDELTHWKKKGLWTAIFSSVAKVPDCLLVVIANAGKTRGLGWQWKVREQARLSPKWYFSRLEGPTASWITQEALAEQREGLTTDEYLRLWLNEWTAGTGDKLDLKDIEACCVLPGVTFNRLDGYEVFVGALDLGLTHDHAAWVVLGLDITHQRLRLCNCRSWDPRKYDDGKIKLADVENGVRMDRQMYGLDGVLYDPWQCERSAETFRTEGLKMLPLVFSNPSNLNVMARGLVQVFRNRQIDIYNEPLLLRDLMRITIEEKGPGLRITSVRDESGHCDRATALAMAIMLGLQWLGELAQDKHQQQEPETEYAV